MLLRKESAGSDSFGHVWGDPGSVVEVSEKEGRILLAIKDGGFSEVTLGRQYEDDSIGAVEPAPVDFPEADKRTVLKPVTTPKLKNPVSKGIDVSTFTE